MINKDRIVPITRTDLLSLFVMILRGTGNTVTVIDVVDGVATVPDDATGNLVANEPVREVKGTAEAELFFCPAYDFAMSLTPTGGADEFDPNPGEICMYAEGSVLVLSNAAIYTVNA